MATWDSWLNDKIGEEKERRAIEFLERRKNTMDDREEQETISVDRLIYLINAAHGMGKKLADQIARGTGGREVALSLTELERARHWAMDAKALLEEQSKL